jgi:hypothetical protein
MLEGHEGHKLQAKYGGARFIDAKTFVRDNPEVEISATFIIGIYIAL